MKKYTVYQIKHIVTGQILYIGKTSDFKRRAYQHITLKTNTKEWLSSIGTSNVLIEEVAKFDNEVDALKYEDKLILKYNTIENGYNVVRSGLIEVENPVEYRRKYCQIEEHKEHRREYMREYEKTEKRKAYQKEYQKSYQKEYRKTEKRKAYQKEYQKEYQIDYRKAKKIGITIDEYRKIKIDQGDTLEQNKKQPIQLTINF